MASPASDFRNKAQEDHPGSTVVERGRRHIKHQKPDGGFILDLSLGAIHYGSQYDQEIDTAWTDSNAPWDKEMVLSSYNAYALSTFSNGQVIKYVHPDSEEEVTFQPQQLQFTNDLDQIQAIGDPQSVSAVVDDDELQWSDAYGTDLDFAWETQTSRLAKRLTVQNLAALGTPAQYIIDGGNPVLRLQFIFQVSQNVDIYINGEKWDKTKTKETQGAVEFRKNGHPLWWFGYAHASDSAADNVALEQRFTKRANSLFVEVRVPWEWLESASYPVLVDPTIDDQIDNGYHDAHEDGDNTSFTNSNSIVYIKGQPVDADRTIAGLIFDPINIGNSDTIDVAYITIKAYSSTLDDPYLELYCEDEDDVNDFNTEQDVYNRTKTSASVSWVDWDLGTDWSNSPSIISPIQEVINRGGWSSGNALCIIGDGDDSNARNLAFDSYDGSTTDCAKLHIEYTSSADTISVSDGITLGESVTVEKAEGVYIDDVSDGITVGESVTTYSDTQDINWDISESDNITVGDMPTVEIPPIVIIPTFIGKQETTYEVWLCDQYGRRLTILDNLIGFDIVKVVNDVSYCSVTLPGNFNETYQTQIGVDYMIEFWRSPAQGAMTLENVFFVREIYYEEDTKGNDIIILAGPDGNDLLDRRIVAYAAGNSESDKTDNADDMMKEIVTENLGSSVTDTDRDLTDLNFTVAGDVTGGPSITKGFAWRNVLKTLKEIAYMSAENGTDLYFDVVPIVVSSSEIGFEFRTYTDQPGQDRTYDTNNPVVFSKEWGNLANPILLYDYTKEANYIYGGGQGEGTDRTISEQSDTTRIGASVWNRREKFADARNEATSNGVANKAEEVLNENKPFKRFTGQLLDTPQARYGVDWFFGDKVVISYRGIQFQGIAKALKIKLDREGNEILTVKVEVTG
jgi:hypothetical protein